ncbi:MAG: M20/M25/M40 family metallo-hydrolase [Verrucomicrobiota bacterium]
MSEIQDPQLLVDLLEARSPTGHEFEAQAVLDREFETTADAYEKDVMGNRIARINTSGDPIVMLAGHIDELGLIIKHIDKKGFLYFDVLGGHDISLISGRRVSILTDAGVVSGVTGKRAIHLMEPEDRKRVPKKHELWIDIGAKSDEEACERVSIGDPVVYDMGFERIHGTIATARAFDDKVGAYTAFEVLKRIQTSGEPMDAQLVAVGTTQEEIGTRGATTSAFSIAPHIGIAIDVGHATDHPDTDPRKHGLFKMGDGPIIGRGPNINPFVYKRLIEVATAEEIPYQIEAEPRPTGTDARAIQMAGPGVAASVVSIPLRYMHTPSEVLDLEDLENTVKLLVAFTKSLKTGEHGIW